MIFWSDKLFTRIATKGGQMRVEEETVAWQFGLTPSSASSKLTDRWTNVTLQADKLRP
jgi:hypothetical protein